MKKVKKLEVNILSQNWISSLSHLPGSRFVLMAVNSKGSFSSYFDYLDDVAKQLGFSISILEGNSMTNADVFNNGESVDLDVPAIRIKCQYDRYGKKVLENSGVLCERVERNDLEDSFFVFADSKPDRKSYFKLAVSGFLSYLYSWRLLLSALVVLIAGVLKSGITAGLPFVLVLLLLSFLGLYLSSSSDFGKNKKDLVAEKICPKKRGQKKSDCEKVGGLSGSFLGLISYTELGILFFATTILSYLIGTMYYESNDFLFMLSLIFGAGGVVFSVHSIVTQLKLGVFCKICGLVILVPYLIVLTGWLAIGSVAGFSIGSAVEAFSVILIAFTVVATDRYVHQSSQELFKLQSNYKYDLYRFIDNENVWRVLYDETPVLEDWGEITEKSMDLNPVESKDFSNTVVLIVSLHCSYCHEALKKCQAVIDGGAEIAFKVMIEDTEIEDDADSPSVYLLNILRNDGIVAFLKALDVWYMSRDIDLFKKTLARKNKLVDEVGLGQARKQLLLQQELLYKIPYEGAPSLLLDGKLVDRMYQFDYLVDRVR